ncbi:hypothetical protein C8A00DRAFT_34850 [Chaetomidium leptoderma]|uniref:Uncharacterized protein n=1 Tax=Chaetomidium leptoderma TaxID=669021 RepID=A0AAN6VLM5_9PEZI|nr:hypothetical protein C8A00DRAFT_34850 [Chaetomidium leptoderma]
MTRNSAIKTCLDFGVLDPLPFTTFILYLNETNIHQLNTSTDLPRIIAKAELESRKGPRNKWAPGAWAAAAAYNATKPEVRCPVIVGGDSMIQTPEQLRNLCQLASVPPLTQTTETTLFPFPDEDDKDQDKKTLNIADVSLRQYLDLQKCTEGDTVVVWFGGQRRYAWLACSESLKTEG